MDTLIGDNLKRLRKKHKYTQEKLAEVADCSWRYIQAIEQGVRTPSIKWLDKLADKLDVPIDTFFKSN